MTNSEPKNDEKTNNGFLLGLTFGAAVGALSAILVNKSNETEIIQNFESKVKDFFRDLTSETKPKKEASKKIEFIDAEEETEEMEKPPIIIKRKTAPKMFVKPKR